jgi:molybdopterin-guanine dinucleotide biosynthesis protein A
MGTNKALLPVKGKPNIQHIRDEMLRLIPEGAASDETPHFLIVTNEPGVYDFLGEEMVSDKYPGLGPLAGIQAGLQASPCDWNLVVACDMPLATAEAGLYLLEKASGSSSDDDENGSEGNGTAVDAVVPVIDGQLHPLFAAYHKRCADLIEEMLVMKQLRMIYLLDKLRVKRLTEADFPAHMETERVFFNMNRPEEWEQVKLWIDIERRGNA